MHQIILKDLVFYSHIGVFDFEKTEGQEFRLDLVLEFGYIEAADQDDLQKTCNYAEIYQLLTEYFAKSRVNLLEYACSEIIDLLLDYDASIVSADLTLKKPEAPIEGQFAYMAVREKRKRNNLVYLSLGSNLGDSAAILKQAIERIEVLPEVSHLRASEFIQTMPWGKTDQPNFVNAAVELIYRGSPFKLLRQCQKIESDLGRKRLVKWGPRLIDIDIIFFDDLEINSPELIIPHPYFRERDFVMEPIMELKRQFPLSK